MEPKKRGRATLEDEAEIRERLRFEQSGFYRLDPWDFWAETLELERMPWCLLKNMVGRFPLQKWRGVSLQKWPGISLKNWPNTYPRKTWASKVGPKELQFGGRYFRRVPNNQIFENSKIVQLLKKNVNLLT
ncbi:hypothetical protein L3X38_003563 [Prunus dulcis]|uniref:Uncharacterized protein n=1 Tax=Prunus dulcis TaxID=3755 RepID=A0AAD5F239_PRUDU|nr:hypothetical protein L3X38_003563 [Prunus dulcis]